ncbi:MAG TPA: cytochrome P450, partial [Myxococcaceae bacterium]|nr:cytochrome P450 [Myxococcaceae bacterium]
MSCLLSADSDRSGAQLRVCPAKAGAGSSRCGATAPGPRGWETVSALLALRKNPLRALLGLRARWGSLVRVPVGKRTFHLVTDHQAAGRVLRDNARNYGKDTWSYGLLGEVLGTGLLTSEGRLWRERRRLAQPAFQGAALASVA